LHLGPAGKSADFERIGPLQAGDLPLERDSFEWKPVEASVAL